jgi:uncharacterized protein (UPF0276 family)
VRDLPERGVGVTFVPGLEVLLEAGEGLVDFVEVEPQTFWSQGADTGALDAAATRILDIVSGRPALVHGVGAPVGGTTPPTDADRRNLAAISERLDAAWVSEHLSYNRVRTATGTASTALMLPPVQTVDSARIASAAITAYQSAVGRPFAFETGVNYLGLRAGDLSDGRWWREVAEQADCGIVLDLHNVWCNARNGRQPLDELFDELPLERVWEVHVAGGEQVGGVWLDAHSGLVDRALVEITAAVAPRLPSLRAITFEIVPEYLEDRALTRRQIRSMLEGLHRVWERRRPAPARVRATPPVTTPPDDPAAVAAAEADLAKVVLGGPTREPVEPGVAVMQELVAAIRRGLSVTALPLTLRLLRFARGRGALDEAFEHCWAASTPELYADAEAKNLAVALRDRFGDVPHLTEVLAYELALVDLVLEGTPATVEFTCDPGPLLDALRAGRCPAILLHPAGQARPAQMKAAALAAAGSPLRTTAPTAAPSAAAASASAN